MFIHSPIIISNFSKKYPNKEICFQELEFKNKVSVLVGDNGSGKSTILKALMNIIRFEGDIKNDNSVSFMAENPHFPIDITVKEFLHNLSQLDKKDYDYDRYLIKYKLKIKENEYIYSLSKGMKAKLNLIQCLIRNSDIYLLDEPLSGLDEESIKELINDINSSSKSFIISSHLASVFGSLECEVIKIDELD